MLFPLIEPGLSTFNQLTPHTPFLSQLFLHVLGIVFGTSKIVLGSPFI